MKIPILIDTREPWPHPWEPHMPEAHFVRQGLETGDIALATNPSVVVERKTVSDFLGTITAGRDRFERELKRARELHQFHIVVEGSMVDCVDARGGMTMASLIGTVAALSRRHCPIHFACTERIAAQLAFAILAQPYHEANKLAGTVQRVAKKAEKADKAAAPVGDDGKPLY